MDSFHCYLALKVRTILFSDFIDVLVRGYEYPGVAYVTNRG